MKWPTVSILVVFYYITGINGGFIPAAIAAGVAAPGALMLLDSLSQRLKDREPAPIPRPQRDAYSRFEEHNRHNERNVYNERNIYNEENRYGNHDRNINFDRYNRDRENYGGGPYDKQDRDDRYWRENRHNRESKYNHADRKTDDERYSERNRFGEKYSDTSLQRTGTPNSGGVHTTYNINNQNNINNYASALEMPEMAKNVVTNLKYATRDIQPPNVVVPSLQSSRAAQTSVTVNGRPFTKGSNYVIVGSRAIAIQQIEVVVPDSYAFPLDEINIDIIVYDGDLYEHPTRQNVRTTFNGDDLGRDTAIILENQAIPPASVRIAVNGQIVEGDVILNAVTFPSKTDGEPPLPQTGQGVFMLNGQPISPYTFSVGAEKNTAPVRNVKVTDSRGKMLSGMIDIEVSPNNRNEPHPILLINGRPVDSTEVLKVNGELVTAEDLVFYVNGRPSSVVADFAIPMDLMEELSEVAQNSAVIPARNNVQSQRDPDTQLNEYDPSSPYDDDLPVGNRFFKPSRTMNPMGSATPYRSRPTRRPLDPVRSPRRVSKALRRNRRTTE